MEGVIMNIPIDSKIMKIIEGFEFDEKLTDEGKKDLALYLELALIDWIETYNIVNEIKDIGVSIRWEASE